MVLTESHFLRHFICQSIFQLIRICTYLTLYYLNLLFIREIQFMLKWLWNCSCQPYDRGPAISISLISDLTFNCVDCRSYRDGNSISSLKIHPPQSKLQWPNRWSLPKGRVMTSTKTSQTSTWSWETAWGSNPKPQRSWPSPASAGRFHPSWTKLTLRRDTTMCLRLQEGTTGTTGHSRTQHPPSTFPPGPITNAINLWCLRAKNGWTFYIIFQPTYIQGHRQVTGQGHHPGF